MASPLFRRWFTFSSFLGILPVVYTDWGGRSLDLLVLFPKPPKPNRSCRLHHSLLPMQTDLFKAFLLGWGFPTVHEGWSFPNRSRRMIVCNMPMCFSNSPTFTFTKITHLPHCKKRLKVFPSSAGMSLTILSLAGSNLIIPDQGEFDQPKKLWQAFQC